MRIRSFKFNGQAQVTTQSHSVVGSNADNAQGFLKALKVWETVQVLQADIQTQAAVARRLRALPIAKAVGNPVAKVFVAFGAALEADRANFPNIKYHQMHMKMLDRQTTYVCS